MRWFAVVAVGCFLAAPGFASHLPTAPVVGADAVLVNFQFAPQVLLVHQGETVTWLAVQNDKELPHTITSDDGELSLVPDAADGRTFDLSTADGAQKSWTVPGDFPPGLVAYYCKPHAVLGMRGFLVVLS